MNDNNTISNQPSNMNSYNQPTQNNTINSQPSSMNSYNQPTQNNAINSQPSNMNLDQLLKNNSNDNVSKVEPKPDSPKKSGKKSKMPIILLIIVLVICLIVAAIFLLPNDGKDNQLTNPPKDYISINTIEDYEKLINGTYDLTKNYILMKDLDLKDYCKQNICKPIGLDNENGFTGIFDGNNHKISNYYYEITTNGYKIGFFSQVTTGTIKKLTLENAEIRVNNDFKNSLESIGLLVGISRNSIIENSNVTGTIKNENTLNQQIQSIGLLVGKVDTEKYSVSIGLDSFKANESITYDVLFKLNNCSANGTINLNGTKSIKNIGGLVGTASTEYNFNLGYVKGIIENSTSNVEINIESSADDSPLYFASDIGGLVGEAEHIYFYKCGSLGNINAKNANVTGGLIGRTKSSMIKESYAKGNVKATNGAAGFVSYFNDGGGISGFSGIEDSYSIGNIIIENSNALPNEIIEHCNCATFIYQIKDHAKNVYSSGNVIYADSDLTSGKPFITKGTLTLIKDSYYNGDYVDYIDYDLQSTKLNTNSMKDKNSYVNFDFENIWNITEGNTPHLKFEK